MHEKKGLTLLYVTFSHPGTSPGRAIVCPLKKGACIDGYASVSKREEVMALGAVSGWETAWEGRLKPLLLACHSPNPYWALSTWELISQHRVPAPCVGHVNWPPQCLIITMMPAEETLQELLPSQFPPGELSCGFYGLEHEREEEEVTVLRGLLHLLLFCL